MAALYQITRESARLQSPNLFVCCVDFLIQRHPPLLNSASKGVNHLNLKQPHHDQSDDQQPQVPQRIEQGGGRAEEEAVRKTGG